MRTQFSFNFKRWLFPGVLFFGVSLLVALPFPIIYRWIYEGDALVVETISVVETEHVKSLEVREYLKDYVGKPLYGVDLNDMTEVVKRHPWVATVALRRLPPHAIFIEPREREPVAITSNSPRMLIDATGFRFRESLDDAELPVIRYDAKKPHLLKNAAEVIDLYNRTLQRAGKISEVHFDEADAISVVFKNGIHVDLGKNNMKEKWLKLDLVISVFDKELNRLNYIYLGNYPNSQQIAVKFN